MTAIALSIAGSDSSGGAGIQADIKSFSALGVYATTGITAATAQNTRRIRAVHVLCPEIVATQIDAVFEDCPPYAVKIGMLGNAGVVEAVADRLAAHCASADVLDTVQASTTGTELLTPRARDLSLERLLPLAALVTPNLGEAAALTGTALASTDSEFVAQAESMIGLGARSALIKGGYGTGPEAVDMLLHLGGLLRFVAPLLPAGETHGSGCTLSSAIAVGLALALPLLEAVERSKQFVSHAIAGASTLDVGRGVRPLDQLAYLRQQADR